MNHLALAFFFAPQDLMLILAVALIFFGPKRLPELGESMGKAMRSFKDASTPEEPDHNKVLPPVQPPVAALPAESQNLR
jgi:sec-independent protein translocase protein TatA